MGIYKNHVNSVIVSNIELLTSTQINVISHKALTSTTYLVY